MVYGSRNQFSTSVTDIRSGRAATGGVGAGRLMRNGWAGRSSWRANSRYRAPRASAPSHREVPASAASRCTKREATVGLPATRWMAEIGAAVIGTDTELLLKSRRVVSSRLREAGFEFRFPHWAEAAQNLAERRR